MNDTTATVLFSTCSLIFRILVENGLENEIVMDDYLLLFSL